MLIKTSTSKNSSSKAKELGERLLAKAKDETAKFPKSKLDVCASCLGTTLRPVYHYGKRSVTRCESAVWNKEKKRFICLGNPDSDKLEQANKKDLISQIWKIVVFLKQKESFLLWLDQEYKTGSISSFPLQQLELVLNKVKSQSIFVNNQETQQNLINKAA